MRGTIQFGGSSPNQAMWYREFLTKNAAKRQGINSIDYSIGHAEVENGEGKWLPGHADAAWASRAKGNHHPWNNNSSAISSCIHPLGHRVRQHPQHHHISESTGSPAVSDAVREALLSRRSFASSSSTCSTAASLASLRGTRRVVTPTLDLLIGAAWPPRSCDDTRTSARPATSASLKTLAVSETSVSLSELSSDGRKRRRSVVRTMVRKAIEELDV